jgi:DNA-binding HxlR family transcriptional regulator
VCTVARALDVIGDRWTLLILRELLGGPARFSELQGGLAGIAKNLLTDRLRRLEGDGLVRRVSTAHTTLYTVTDLGEATRPIVEALGTWGGKAPKLGPLEHDRSIRSVAVALHTFVTRAGDALPEERTVVELAVDDELLEIVLGPQPRVIARSSADPDARMRTTKADMTHYLHGRAFEKRAWPLVSGDKAARAVLLRVMAVFF